MSNTITIEGKVLADAMKRAAGIVAASQTIPILANARLSAAGDALEIVTTDLDTELRQTVSLKRGGTLATTVDARKLAALANAVEKGAQIELALDGASNRLTVKSGRSRWVLPVLPVEDFPLLPFDSTHETSADAADLASSLSRVLTCVHPHGAINPFLQGAYFNSEEGQLQIAATDRHRMMIVDVDVAWDETAPAIVVPTKYLQSLQSVCEAGRVTVKWSERLIRVEIGGLVLTGKTIDQGYVEYRRVLSGEECDAIRVDPASLRAALRRVQLAGNPKTRCVRITRGEGKMLVEMADGVGAEAAEEVPADCAPGFATAFNASYLEQMLDAIGGDTLTMQQSDPKSNARFTRTPPDRALGLVYPMHI